MRLVVGKIALSTVLLVSLLALVVILVGFQLHEEIAAEPSYTVLNEFVAVDASAWLIFDVATGEELASVGAAEQLPIASVTKLATAAMVRLHNDMQATITIAYSDTLEEGRAGKLQAGEVYTAQELLFPLLLESSNDAAVALARFDEEALERMNELATELELPNTTFTDTSGLSAGNVSTPAELAVLTAHIYHTQPFIFDITRISEYFSAENGWYNNSPFITDPDYRGGKHGFTYEANRTAVAFFTEQFAGGERLVGYVLLGSDDLGADMQALRAFVAGQVRFE